MATQPLPIYNTIKYGRKKRSQTNRSKIKVCNRGKGGKAVEKLSRFERARLIGARALQLSLGAPTLIKGAKNLSIYEIAKLEFDRKILPLAVLRKLPFGEVKKVSIF